MTTDAQASEGRKLFGTGVSLFGHGFIWFHAAWPGGIFTPHPLNLFDALFRAEIVIGVVLAAYGVLVWRNAFRDLSVANCVIVCSCVPILLVCVSKLSEWNYVLHKQSRYVPGAIVVILMTVCISVLAALWADSAHLREWVQDFSRSSGSISGAAAGVFLCLALMFLSLIDSSSNLGIIGLYFVGAVLSVHLAGKLWSRSRGGRDAAAAR